MWAEGRIHDEYDAIRTPFGYIPRYEDLKALFKEIFNKNYSLTEYIEQFSIRIKKLVEKLDRMEKLFQEEPEIPEFFWRLLHQEREKLLILKKKYSKDIVSPLEL